MGLNGKVISTILFLALFMTFISCKSQLKSDSIETAELRPIKSFGGIDVSKEAILGSPSDMAVSAEGEIILIDSRENKICIFDENGNLINKFGKPGQGPDELQGPRFLAIEGDTIKVFEQNNSRIHYFLKNGQSAKIIPCKFSVGIGSFIFGFHSDVFFATGGFRTEDLIRHYRETGEELEPIGKIEGNSFEIYEMLKIRDDLIKNDVPDALKNQIILVINPDHRLYAVYQALPLIKIFSPDRELEKIVQLKLTEFEGIIDQCAQFNLEEKQKGSLAFRPLRFWRDGAITGNGDLMLLMSDPEKMILYRFRKDGKPILRYKGVDDDIGMIAVRGQYLWALGRETQIFYEFKIEK